MRYSIIQVRRNVWVRLTTDGRIGCTFHPSNATRFNSLHEAQTVCRRASVVFAGEVQRPTLCTVGDLD